MSLQSAPASPPHSTAQAILDPKDFKCWICLGTADEAPPHGLPNHEWRRPCKCNLVAHQTCLLDWTAEIASKASFKDRNKLPECPQCKEPIYIAKNSSRFLAVREFIEAANAKGFQVIFFSAISGSIISAVYTSLYTLGAVSIRCMCPQALALRLLGIVLTDQGIQLQPLSVRRMLMIPATPLLLLLAGSRSRFADLIMLSFPLTLADRHHPPWKFTGPRFTLAMLPVVRIIYHMAYDALIDPIIQLCASRLRPSHIHNVLANGPGNEDGINIQLVLEADEEEEQGEEQAEGNGAGEDRNEENINGENEPVGINDNDDNIIIADIEFNGDINEDVDAEAEPARRRGIMGFIMRHLADFILNQVERAIPPQQEAHDEDNNNINNVNNMDNENNNGHRRGWHRVRRNADWVISPHAISLRIGNALLWPLLSGMLGGALSKIHIVRKLIPGRFNRNILGGLLIVLLRDLVNVSTALLRVRQENSRRVLEYTDVHTP